MVNPSISLKTQGNKQGNRGTRRNFNPNAQCPMPNAQCPMPHAPCPYYQTCC
ncbi:hypothetical protein [Nostoc sp. CMAA1605]|uniref:hypothetical protein n=1 Tax=Nostoc sp. CMAA1605 TaxID=2055159 RepID=UPI001F47A110|nr:hypothetical protein [Nostoc sp. CMAA1605]